SLAFSPDGKTLACGFSDHSCLLDVTTSRVLHRLSGRPASMAFAPDGKTLVASSSYRLRFWDVATGQELHDRPGDFGHDPAMALTLDGRLLAAADWWMDPAVSLWDTTSGGLVRRLPLEGAQRYVCNLAFAPDGQTLVASYQGFLQFRDVTTGQERRTVQLNDPGGTKRHEPNFYQLHVSPDGKHASTLEQIVGHEETTRLARWEIPTGKLLRQHSLPAGSRHGTWSADGTAVALALKDGLTLVDVDTGAVRFRIPGVPGGGPVAASPDGRLLAAR